jgi:uncharacterized protein YdeI (YjbR/CyaY-like superfamily)
MDGRSLSAAWIASPAGSTEWENKCLNWQSSRIMSTKNPKVDAFLAGAKEWREESRKMRQIALACGLTEELKWNKPCYSFQGSNVVIIQGFRDYCALMFCKGALLKDAKGVLTKPGEHTQAARQARFTSLQEIVRMEPLLKSYINEAIAAEKAGLEVKFKTTPEPVPAELQRKLDESPALKKAFGALTPGRQRAYILFISSAKQSTTREARVEKYRQRILSGKGMLD